MRSGIEELAIVHVGSSLGVLTVTAGLALLPKITPNP